VAGLNKLTIIGNLGRDPEMRYLPSGSPVTNFSVAVSRRWTGRDGEQREETDWFNVSCFDKLAETANQYLAKGRQVYIEGQVRARTWDDQQTGEKRVSLDVRANQLVLLGQRGDQEFGGDRSFGGEPAASRASAADTSDFDNMPF
jgi:single-strand DNA-binding protein